MNRAVCSAAPAADTEPPSPTASEDPYESNRITWGMWRISPALLSWLHITPDEVIRATEDRSYAPGSASRWASIGPAKA